MSKCAHHLQKHANRVNRETHFFLTVLLAWPIGPVLSVESVLQNLMADVITIISHS